MDKFYAIDSEDQIVKCLADPSKTEFIENYKSLKDLPVEVPVIFRSMAQRKTVATCKEQGRDYFYIDTGYIGNLEKRKHWHRVVHNNMQHVNPKFNLPNDRFAKIAEGKEYLPFSTWRKDGRAILVVTPSNKPCSFYGINRDEWLSNTLATIRENTDRPVIVRDKGLRKDRIGNHSIYNQFVEDDVFAVVTYNSIAATEAIGFGIPAFTSAPNAADYFCSKDLTKIENPVYKDEELVKAWQNWLGYCQYTPKEMSNGEAFRIIEEYNLS